MAVWTDVLDTSFNFPNIDIYRRLEDGELSAYIARAQEGYVFYDTTEDNRIPQTDPETGELVFDPETGMPIEIPVTYYYTLCLFPKTYNMANFSLVAVPRDSVDENYIFGDVEDNDHEIM